ncbi:MaoC family dehydratase N-terminal domain-containing protein [Streptomyces sp. NPDC048106]|uniref:FAS1-like dehydratase domain-containing protein n=1 Tax=Streptomyces sp. NPDC048106 TaxID=3155750 RepID=UPI00345625F6
MSENTLIRHDMRDLIGSPYARRISYPVSASDIRKWARAVHHPRPAPVRYTDPAAEDGDLLAPYDFNPFAWGCAEQIPDPGALELDEAYKNSGAMEHRLGVTPPNLRRALNGGLRVDYGTARMRPGHVITAQSAVAGYEEKQGRLGTMLLTEVATTWTNQEGRLVKTLRMTLIRY